MEQIKSPKSKMVTLILAVILGAIGAHRFYVGKVGTGILLLIVSVLSSGLFGFIWAVIDIIVIVFDKFEDRQGKVITS